MAASRVTAPNRPALRLVSGAEPAAREELPAIDPQDFDAVFRRFAPYVARVALRLLGNDAEVDDLVQDVFLEAHRGLGSLRDPLALGGWLSRICVRRATRRLRRRRLLLLLSLETLTDHELPLSHAATPEQRAEVAQLYQRLDRLPVDDRVAWLLRYVEGESLEDMVLLCGCSKSTVQRRLLRAETRLAQEVTS